MKALQKKINILFIIQSSNTFYTFLIVLFSSIFPVISYAQLATPTGTVTNSTCSNTATGSISITNMTTANALTFSNASNNYVNLGSSLLSNKGKFTLEGWIRFKYADLSGKTRMSLFGQNNTLEFGFSNATTIELYSPVTGAATATIPTGLNESKWHHIAAVGDGSNIKIYFNGILLSTTTAVSSNYGSDTTYNSKIGGGVIDATGGSFPGSIMKVGLYSTALSATEITKLANCPKTYTGSETGLIAAYNFFDGSGLTLTKLPTGTNGTLENSPVWSNPYNYAWTGPSGFTAVTKNISSLVAGNYSVTVSTGGICTETKSFLVESSTVVPAITNMTATICNTVDFTSTPVNGTNGYVPAGTTFSWSAPVVTGGLTGGLASSGSPTSITGTLTNPTTTAQTATYTVVPYVSGCTGNTFTLIVTVNSPGSIGNTQTICSGTAPAAITSTAPGTGSGTISYEWQTDTSGSFTTVTGATNATYTPPALTATTKYRRRTLATSGGITCYSDYSNEIIITVRNPIPLNVRTDTNPTCDGFIARWNIASASLSPDYYIDIATTSTFTAGTFAPGYNNTNLGYTSNHTVTGLQPNTTYYFRVRAVSNSPNCTSANSLVEPKSTFPTTLAPVQGNTGATTCDGFTLNWSLAQRATSYYIDIATTNTFLPSEMVAGKSNIEILSSSIREYVVTGLEPGTYYTRIRASGPCGTSPYSITKTGVANGTVKPTLSAITHPTCASANGNLSITNYSTENVYTITPTGAINNAGAITGTAGTYTMTAKSNLTSCVSPSVTFTINTQPATPIAPAVGTRTHPDCKITTGTVVLNGLPSSGTWDLYQTGTTSPIVTGGSGTTYTVTGLTGATYTFTVKNNVGCTSPISADVVINPVITNTWNGSAWSNGGNTPTLTQAVIFNGNYNSTSNVDACSCLVKSGRTVTFNSGNTLKINHQLIVENTANLTFQNNASLVQINDSPSPSNSGIITYNRASTPILKTDYVYWSAPVSGFTLGAIVPGTLYYSYNASTNFWSGESESTIMGAGVGYIVRGGGTWFDTGSTSVSAAFKGEPHNGLVSATSGGAGKTTLTGNPYPSAIDADAFIIANSAVLDGALYFWTHNTAIQLASGITNGSEGTGKYAYTSDDYATYTLTGGVGTGAGGASASGSSNIPNGSIASGVAFFADGKGAAGSVIFNNSMRLGSGGSDLVNSKFFRPGSSIKTAKTTTTTIVKNRLWLNLTNTQGAFKQTLIGYISGASNSYDSGYDALSYDGNMFIDFYSINENNPLTIQGRALPFQDTDKIPLGYRSTIAGEFTIAIDNTDGIMSNQDVFLEDKLTLTTHNLKQSPYKFTTSTGIFDDRFTISYKTEKTLGIDNIKTLSNGVIVSQKGNTITITSSIESIGEVFLYDISGKLISRRINIDSKEITFPKVSNSAQVLLFKIKLENDQIILKKVLQQFN
ncbi:LamG-like jellyroll fold domain-containing protein [Flavobacterium sp. 7A]|uniref:LamG-like jellyroll fold domain-containing protein n=1 Tax=Flavobacterium sp. 7A TaxID=2940571 RepID=UPI002225BDAF|nr:LamG-like jellyroll fold domain-containing protein [Flavobacterium sp. 7A]MCW2121118.1 hypothetical protein [Flavobacterium sp. 7A]